MGRWEEKEKIECVCEFENLFFKKDLIFRAHMNMALHQLCVSWVVMKNSIKSFCIMAFIFIPWLLDYNYYYYFYVFRRDTYYQLL